MSRIILILNHCLKCSCTSTLLSNEIFLSSVYVAIPSGISLCFLHDTWVTYLFHRQEDFQIELRNDADLYIPFARTALIERTTGV
jgi:hypothetical protein